MKIAQTAIKPPSYRLHFSGSRDFSSVFDSISGSAFNPFDPTFQQQTQKLRQQYSKPIKQALQRKDFKALANIYIEVMTLVQQQAQAIDRKIPLVPNDPFYLGSQKVFAATILFSEDVSIYWYRASKKLSGSQARKILQDIAIYISSLPPLMVDLIQCRKNDPEPAGFWDKLFSGVNSNLTISPYERYQFQRIWVIYQEQNNNYHYRAGYSTRSKTSDSQGKWYSSGTSGQYNSHASSSSSNHSSSKGSAKGAGYQSYSSDTIDVDKLKAQVAYLEALILFQSLDSEIKQLAESKATIDKAVLKAAYKRLVQKYHPDKHPSATADEKSKYEEMIKSINKSWNAIEAYFTLKPEKIQPAS